MTVSGCVGLSRRRSRAQRSEIRSRVCVGEMFPIAFARSVARAKESGIVAAVQKFREPEKIRDRDAIVREIGTGRRIASISM